MSKFIPNWAQAARLKQLADDGSDNFGEKLSNYERLHDACQAQGRAEDCPCSACS